MDKCKCGGALWKHGSKRFKCKVCGKTCSEFKPKYTQTDRERAIHFYLNNCGVRKTALFMRCSPGTILNWIRKSASAVEQQAHQLSGDIVEMDEIWARTDKRIAQKNEGKAVLR